MNLYSFFYCNSYFYYYKRKKKQGEGSLRLSAIALISFFEMMNIVSVMFFSYLPWGLLSISEWWGVFIAAIVSIVNLSYFTKEKINNIKNEYSTLAEEVKKKMKLKLNLYKAITIVLVVVIITIVIEKKGVKYT